MTAALVCFAVVMIPATIEAYLSSFVAGWWPAGRTHAAARRFRFTLFDALLFCVMLAVLFAWYGTQMQKSWATSKVRVLGGSVTWNAIEDPRGFSEVDFRGTELTDAQLSGVLSALRHFRRVDLILEGTQVTNAGVSQLTGLTNLVRLRLEATGVSDTAVAELKDALPNLEILR